MIDSLSIYICVGIIWAVAFEYFCINKLEEPYNAPFVNRERLWHVLVWPFNAGLFLYHLILEARNNKDNH